MSVRIAYLTRGGRGSVLTGVRLVGQSSDQSLPARDGAERGEAPRGDGRGGEGVPRPLEPDDAARWIKEKLAAARSTRALALLCLDTQGAVCSWLTSPSREIEVVAATARQASFAGRDLDAPARSGGVLEFYAGDATDSSIEPLAAPKAAEPRRSLLPGRGKAESNGAAGTGGGAGGTAKVTPERLPVLAVQDVPARLVIDALDRVSVPVEGVCTLWHLMASAWDPSRRGSQRSGGSEAVAGSTVAESSGPMTAVLVVDPAGRLLWAWSRDGALVAAGSVRLAVSGDEDALPVYGESDVARVCAEWLSWAAQVGSAPARAVCIVTPGVEGTEPAAFGAALGRAWEGLAVDLVTAPDPVLATLERAAAAMESTPAPDEPSRDPSQGLVGLGSRPGKRHRRMYLWSAGALAAMSAMIAVSAWRLGSLAAAAQSAANGWRNEWRELIQREHPEAAYEAPGQSMLQSLEGEVNQRERAVAPIAGTGTVMPVLREVEALTLVMADPNHKLVSLIADSDLRTEITVIVPDTATAEQLVRAVQRVSGSAIASWNPRLTTETTGQDRGKVRLQLTGIWTRPGDRGGEREGGGS